MLILEFKAYGKSSQYSAIEEALRTAKFIQNKCLRYWMDNKGVSKYDLNKYCAVLAKEFPFADQLNSMARQARAERTWSAISRFYENCKKQVPGKKGVPQFKKLVRSVEYKTSGWKLAENRKTITFTDGKQIGTLKLKGTRDLHFYQPDQIKRVRLVKRADGYYVQFAVPVERSESVEPAGKAIGLDVGLNDFYVDQNDHRAENPRFLRKGEHRIQPAQRRVSRKVKGSNNKITIAVPPHYTSQECSSCGGIVKKGLSTRTHVCGCGTVLNRDHNAARNILSRGLATVGHTGSFGLEPCNAWGETTSTEVGAILPGQVVS